MNSTLQKKLRGETDRLIAVYNAGNFIELEKSARRYVKLFPEQPFGRKVLAVALQKQKKYQAAVSAYAAALELNPGDPELHNNLAIILKELGSLAEAESAARAAVQLRPDYAVAYNTLGNILRGAQRSSEAQEAYQTALRHNPRLAMVHNNLGNLHRELYRIDAAVESYKAALALDPDVPEARKNLGAVLLDAGRCEEAFACYAELIKTGSGDSEDLNRLGTVLQGLQRFDEAETVYREALRGDPQHSGLLTNLGNVLGEQGRRHEALVCYRQAAAQPGPADAVVHLAMSVLPTVVAHTEEAEGVTGDFCSALEQLEDYARSAGWSRLGTAISVRLPFNLSYRVGNHREILAKYGDIAAKARREWLRGQEPVVCAGKTRPSDRIRLGIVSAHVRRHSVWYVILRGLLANLDRSRFEIIVYHTGTACDSETALARTLADRFEQGPQEWTTVIRRDAPDILFYPDLAMEPATFELGLLRLAPLQATTWGHPITSGLPEIDLFFSGELLEGAAARDHYREELVLLPGTGACCSPMMFDRKPLSAEIPHLPADRGVPRFLICQRAMKFDPAFDGLYAEIARRADQCHFWFIRDLKIPWASAIVEQRIAAAFRSAGLDPDDYITWVDWIPGDQFWAFMQEMDIFLDTPAFSGYTTAWQAVHCGLPVVTLEGEYLRQRLAAGLLRRIGVTETIAHSFQEYVALAVELGNDPVRRTGLRQQLRAVAGEVEDDLAVVRAFERELVARLESVRPAAR